VKLLCIDFSNLVIRHASNPYGGHKDLVGRPVWGATGALAQVLRLIDQHRPTHLLIARDCKRDETWRRELSDAYKEHRPDADEDLTRQFTLAYRAVEMFGWPCVMMPRYEADDVIASAAHAFDGHVAIVTGDRDLLALCSDTVTVWLFRPGGPEAMNAAGCQRLYGVEPRQVRDYKALVGDKSDGIAGVDGIGPKGAVKLLSAFGSVAGIYRRLDKHGDLGDAATAHVQRKLAEGREQARLSWQLAGLVSNLDVNIDQLKLGPRPTWKQHGDALSQLGLHDMEKALTGAKTSAQKGPVDMEAVFQQLTLS